MNKKSNYLSKDDYDNIFSKVPRLCVDIVIKTDKGILLSFRSIKPYKDKWHLPGGRVYFRESLHSAVCRIAKGEAGLSVKNEKFLGFMEFTREVQDKKKRHSVSIAFLVDVSSGKIRKDNQSSRIDFFKKIPIKIHPIHERFLKTIWHSINQ